MIFGTLVGLSVSELVAQFGWGRFYHGSIPWWGGLVVGLLTGILLSVVRSVSRRARIQVDGIRSRHRLRQRTEGARVVLALVALGATFGMGHDRASAQAVAGACAADVSLPDVPSRSIHDTSQDHPFEIAAKSDDVVTVDWAVPEGALPPYTMTLWTDIAGYRSVIHRSTVDDADGVYKLSPTEFDVAPGVYLVRGELVADNGQVLCQGERAWIRVVGSPFQSRFGLLAIGGIALGGAALTLTFRDRSLNDWTYTSPDLVTQEILNPSNGKKMRGPLVPGTTYLLRTRIAFPDPPGEYEPIPEPVVVATGVLGGFGAATSVAHGAGSQVDQNSPVGVLDPAVGLTAVSLPFRVPLSGEAFELVTDISVGGNVLRTMKIFETATSSGRSEVFRAFGQVGYSVGSWAAQDLMSIRPVDASVTMHGSAAGDRLETWAYRKTAIGERQMSRTPVDVEQLRTQIERYRQQLEACIAARWAESSAGESGSNQVAVEESIRALAACGTSLRSCLLHTDEPVAPVDGVISVSQDTAATGALTIPWSGLYRALPRDASGREDPNAVDRERPGVCSGRQPQLCEQHDDATICPNRFWATTYDIAWPNGWAPTLGRDERRALALMRSLRTARFGSLRLVPNLLDNHYPVRLHSAVNVEFADEPGIETLLPGGQCSISMTLGRSQLIDELYWVPDTEIVHLLGHGVATADQDFALSLDDKDSANLDGASLLKACGRQRLQRGPIVILNACESGVITAAGSNGLVDAFWQLGARGIIVTESRVDDLEAIDVISEVITDVLAGEYVSRAVRNARRRCFAERSDMSGLSFTFYGPPGLRLANPVIDLSDEDRDGCSPMLDAEVHHVKTHV